MVRLSWDEKWNWGWVCGLSRIIRSEKLCSVSRKHSLPLDASKLLEATETKQTMSATLDPITLYMNKWGQGAPPVSLVRVLKVLGD